MPGGRAAIAARETWARIAPRSYSTSSGPKHSTHTNAGPVGSRWPHARQRRPTIRGRAAGDFASGRAAVEARVIVGSFGRARLTGRGIGGGARPSVAGKRRTLPAEEGLR